MGFMDTDMAHLNGLVGTTRELDHETQHCTVQLEQLDTRLECRGDKLESSGVALECNALYSRCRSPWSCLRGRVDLSLRSGVDCDSMMDAGGLIVRRKLHTAHSHSADGYCRHTLPTRRTSIPTQVATPKAKKG